jgi:hypothetical protein
MSFVTNENQQMGMHDSLNSLTDREKRMLEKSWAARFSKIVFPAINEDRFSVLYSDNPASRPNTPVNVVIGSLLLKEMFGLTDEELMEEVTFNIQYQYALRTTSFEEQPLSDRTLSRFREKVYNYAETHDGLDLIQEEMRDLADQYAKFMKLSRGVERMDSMMVSSSCRRMSRLSHIYMTVRGMAEAVKKAGGDLPEEYRKYLKDSESEDIGYRLKGDEIIAKMDEVLRDAASLLEFCRADYSDTGEYRRLKRMIDDQSKVVCGERIAKDGSEILPTSMQNPSDEDATYRKKGKVGSVGYSLNLEEACSENGNLVMDYDYKTNRHTDVEFARDVLEKLPDENGIDVIITDGAYGSSENLELAEKKGVKLAATTLVGGTEDNFEAQFEIDEESNTIIRCPAGFAPQDSTYNEKKDMYRAHYDKETCENCPHCDRCPGIFLKKRALIRFSKTARIRAQYFDKINTEEYKQYARLRNGVEGVPSVLRRRYGVDRMPVRGLLRSKIWIGFKIGAMNTVRLLKTAAVASFSANIVGDCTVLLVSILFFPKRWRYFPISAVS